MVCAVLRLITFPLDFILFVPQRQAKSINRKRKYNCRTLFGGNSVQGLKINKMLDIRRPYRIIFLHWTSYLKENPFQLNSLLLKVLPRFKPLINQVWGLHIISTSTKLIENCIELLVGWISLSCTANRAETKVREVFTLTREGLLFVESALKPPIAYGFWLI